MADSNEYDSILAGNAPEGNEYDAILEGERGAQKSQIQQSMFAAQNEQPDRQAEVLRLSERTKLPANIVARNFDEVAKKSATADLDYDSLITNSPGLAKFLEDSGNATLAKDDLDSQKLLEQKIQDHGVLDTMYNSLGYGFAKMNESVARIPGLLYDTAALPQNLFMKAIGRPERQVRAPEWLANNAVAEHYEENTKAFQKNVPELSQSAVTEISNGNFLRAGQIAAAQFVANSPQQAAILLSAIASYGGAGLALAGATSAADKNREAREQGFDPATGTATALATGGIEAGFESLGTFGIFNQWEKAVAQQVGKVGSREFTKSVLKTLGHSVAGEANEEFWTSIAQDITDYGSGLNPHAIKGMGTRALDAGLIGGLSGGLTTGPSAIATATARSNAVQRNVDFYSQLGEHVQQTKLLERMPEKQRELILRMTEGSAVENVYIPVRALETYFQDKKANPVQVMQAAGVLKEFNEAQETGADVKIPLASWVTGLVKSEHYEGLKGDIKFSPDGITMNEAAVEMEIAKQIEQQIKDEADKAQASREEFNLDQSAALVRDQVAEQLRSSGVDSQQAVIYEAAFKSLGQRLGMDPMALFKRFNLSITRGDAQMLGEGVYNQPSRSFTFPVRQNEDGSFSVEASDKLGAVGRMNGDSFSYENFTFDPKYSGPAQDVIRSMEQTARAAGARNISAPLSVPELQKAFEAQGYQKVGDRMVKDLTGESTANLKKAIDAVYDAPEAIERYNALPGSNGGQILDTDLARELFAPYAESREGAMVYSAALDEAAGRFIGKLYEERIKAGPPNDHTPIMIMAGGSASGKSRYHNEFKNVLKGVPLILDTTSSDFKRTQERIELAKKHGWLVHVNFIYRPFDKAIEGNKRRFKETGRFVDPGYLAYSHVEAINTFERLEQRYATDERVNFDAFDNSEENRISRAHIENLAKLRYNKGQKPEQAIDRLTKYADERLKDEQEQIRAAKERAYTTGQEASRARATLKGPGQRGLKEPGSGTESYDQSRRSLDQQGQDDGPQGQIHIGSDGININILKDADESTFFHETGHFYLKVMETLAGEVSAPAQIQEDFQIIKNWLGVAEGQKFSVEQHEMFARGFEAYLMEGRAPSSKLRKAFARFKVWLISVYKNLRALDVALTDDVRSVMDRLLATDEEIAQAQNIQYMEPLFSNPESMGLTGEKLERYQAARDEARFAAEEQVSKRLLQDFQREKEAWWKKERAAIRSEIEQEVSGRKIYRALSIVQRGKLPDGSPLPEGLPEFKLSKQAIETLYGKEFLKRLPKPYVYAAKDGLHPDVAAELLGFESGDDMLTQFVNAPKRDELINQLTDKRMSESYPDLLYSNELADEAMKAVHNEKRANLLRLELEHLASNDLPTLKDVIRRVSRRVPTNKMVREQAVGIIAARKVSDLSPYLFQRAEAKSAKEAGEALARGDIDAAFDAKQRELLNHELYRAAVEAQESVDKNIEFFKKLRQADDKLAKSRDMDLVNAARAILANYELDNFDEPPEKFLKPIQQYDPETYATVEALVGSVLSSAGHYEKVSFDDFQAMADTVRSLWDLAKSTRQIEIDGLAIDREQVTAELSVTLNNLRSSDARTGYERKVSDFEKTKMGLLGVRAALRRVESWVDAIDGGDINGPFRRYIWNPISEATSRYRESKKAVIEKYLELVKAVEPSLDQKDIPAPELAWMGQDGKIRHYTFSGKQELLGALLHTGNESNMSKLLRGREWGTEDADGNLDTSQWDSFISRMIRENVLTKADYDFVQGVWDLLEQIKPDAQKVHKKMYGFYFNEVTHKEFMTPFGKYRGGYVPAVADPFIAIDASIREEKAMLEGMNNSFMFPTAGRGFTKSRVHEYARPLTLDLAFIPSHIDKVLRFVHIEPHVKEVGRVVMDRGFRNALDAFDPAAGGDMLVPWLQRAALQKIETPSQGWAGKATDRFFKGLRTRVGFNVMSANITNALQQMTGLSIAAIKVKPRHLRDALWTYVRAPAETSKAAQEKSAFMRTKLSASAAEMQMQIDEMLMTPTKYDKARTFAQKHGYFLQSGFQNVVDVMVWSGAYDQAVSEGMNEVEAVRSADSAVRQTQGSFAAEDISRFETGTPFVRAFTMFYSYFNMMTNLLGTEVIKVSRDMGLKKGAGRLFYVYSLGFMIPAVLSEMIVRVMAGKIDQDDDDEYLDDLMSIFFGSQFRMGSAMVPGLGPAVAAGVNAFNDKWYDDRISTSPAVSMIESSVSAPHSVYEAIAGEGKRKKAIRDTLSLLGLMTGLPLAPAARPLGYLSDVADGGAEPSGPVDFARGLVTGKNSESR